MKTCEKEAKRLETRLKQATGELASTEKELGPVAGSEGVLVETVRQARSRMEEARVASSQQASGNKVWSKMNNDSAIIISIFKQPIIIDRFTYF